MDERRWDICGSISANCNSLLLAKDGYTGLFKKRTQAAVRVFFARIKGEQDEAFAKQYSADTSNNPLGGAAAHKCTHNRESKKQAACFV